MSFEEILTDCLASLDAGATIDECLARYPQHAEQLQPLLQIAEGLRTQPAPRLSSRAFERGRAALWAEAQRQQTGAHRRTTPTPAPAHRPAWRRWRPHSRPIRRRPPPVFSVFHLVTGALVAALLLLSAYTTIRSAGNSLPGDTLYALKRGGETVEGLLMTAAGERAMWHMRQADRRLNESLALENRGQSPDPELSIHVEQSVQAAIDASSSMPADKRMAFLTQWLQELHRLQATVAISAPAKKPATLAPPATNGSSVAEPSSAETLGHVVDTVTTAVEGSPQSPPPLNLTTTNDAAPTPDLLTAPAMISATVQSTKTIAPLPTATHTFTPTSTPTSTPTATPTHPPTATHTPTAEPTNTATWTPTPAPRPTNTSMPRPTKTPTPRPTDTSTPRPTDTSTPQPTDTPTPLPTDTPTTIVTPTSEGDASPTPDVTATGIPTTPEPTSEVTVTPEETLTPEITPTPDDTITPTPDDTVTPTPDDTVTPTPDGSTTPDPTVAITNTPEPSVTITDEPTIAPTESVTPATPEPTISPAATPDISQATPPAVMASPTFTPAAPTLTATAPLTATAAP